MGVKVIRDPQADRGLVLFGTNASVHLAACGWQKINLHAALSKARLHRLRDGDKRWFIFYIQREVGVFDACFSEDLFRFCRVKFEWVVVQCACKTYWQEALVDKVLAF